MSSHISIRLFDPATQNTSLSNLDKRVFEYYRKAGQILFCIRHSQDNLTSASSPIVIETFDVLKQLHHDGNAYVLRNRKTFFLPTYEVALAVVADPSEKHFTTIDDLVYTKPLKFSLNVTEKENILFQFQERYAIPPPKMPISVDGLMLNQAKTNTAFLTSLRYGFDAAYLHSFYVQCLFLHYFSVSSASRDAAQRALWGQYFQEKQVHLYCGFPQSSLTEEQWKFARDLNIQCLVKRGLRYSILK
eukprot:PhF_6_TR21958/c0_g1_i2/m.31221